MYEEIEFQQDIDVNRIRELIGNYFNISINNDNDSSIIDKSILDDGYKRYVDKYIISNDNSLRVSALSKLVKKSGVMPVHANALTVLYDIIYTKLYDILKIALIAKDERHGKILNEHDILNSLQLLDENVIICIPKNEN